MIRSAAQWLHTYRLRRFRHGLLVNALLLFASIILLWLLFLAAEVGLYLAPTVKIGALLLTAAALLTATVWTLVIPAVRFLRGTYFSLEDCARELGARFPELDDKLLNAYQLELMGSTPRIHQAVEERLEQAVKFPIWERFSWTTLRPYAAVLAVLLVFLGISAQYQPTQFAQQRLLAWDETFTPPPPFEVEWKAPLRAEEGQKVVVRAKPIGVQMESWSAEVNGKRLVGQKQSDGSFQWVARMDSQDQEWTLLFGDYRWEVKRVAWVPAVAWNSIRFRIVPPAYTGEKERTVQGLQDLECSVGSVVRWELEADHAELVRWDWNKAEGRATSAPFSGSFVVDQSAKIELLAKGALGRWKSGGFLHVRAIPDAPPVLSVDWTIDSLSATVRAVWRAEDDRALVRVVLGRSEQKMGRVPVATGTFSMSLQGSRESWTAYAVDSKGQRSQPVVFVKPRFGAQDQQLAAASAVRSLAQQAEMTRRSADQLNKRSAEERRRQTQRKNVESAQVQKQAETEFKERALEQMKSLEKAVQSLKIPNADRMAQEKQWEDKRQQIEELLQQMQRPEQNATTQKSAASLQRLEALLEQLLKEQEQLLAIQALERLSEEQKKLSERTDADEQALQKELAEETQELSEKHNSDELEKAKAEQDALKKQSTPSNKDQEKAAESLKKAAEQMRQKMQESQESKTEEEIKSLKQLIDNLLQVSFGLERLSDRTSVAVPADPNYAQWQKELQRLQEGTRLVGDTLRAIGLRRPDIGAKTSQHVEDLLAYGMQAKSFLKERQGSNAGVQLQKAMKESNDLAVLFQEALNNAQQELSNMKKDGTGSCSKPGSGKPSASGMRKMQGQLAEQMKSLGSRPGQQSGQQPGQQPGETGQPKGNQGKSGADGSSGDQAQRASLLAQQERLRRELERSKGGSVAGKEASELMKELERQLIKNASAQQLNQTLKKLDIKLLELERAEKQEEEDEKRQSEVGKDRPMINPSGVAPDSRVFSQPVFRGWPLFYPDYTPQKWP